MVAPTKHGGRLKDTIRSPRPRWIHIVSTITLVVAALVGTAWLCWGMLESGLEALSLAASLVLIASGIMLSLNVADLLGLVLTSDYVQQRQWGRTVQLHWDDVDEVGWVGEWLVLTGRGRRISVRPRLYVDSDDIAAFIIERTQRLS